VPGDVEIPPFGIAERKLGCLLAVVRTDLARRLPAADGGCRRLGNPPIARVVDPMPAEVEVAVPRKMVL
jgi:hypothetical protein